MSKYIKTINAIESIIKKMDPIDSVWLARDIDDICGAFGKRFSVYTIGELVESGRDVVDVVDACLTIGATDYDDLVRQAEGDCWESGDNDSLHDDVLLYADDIAEWLLDHWEEYEGFIFWGDEDAEKEVKRIVEEYWAWYFEHDGKETEAA